MSSVGKLHNGSDHIVVGLSESADGSISGAVSVLHNHIDVLGSETLLGERCRVVDGLLVLLLGGGLGLTSRLLGELLGLGLAETRVRVLESELTEDGE